MNPTVEGTRAGVVAPHHLASQSGLAVLREGGNALEAMVAAAATIAVVYPHMNSIGGDSFWLVHQPGAAPIAIDACGRSGGSLDEGFYRQRGLDAVPPRGPLAANTVAGTVSGWGEAHRLATEMGGRLPLSRLLEDAIDYAERGIVVSRSQAELTAAKRPELTAAPGFEAAFVPQGRLPVAGERFVQPRLADTLRTIAGEGTESFYRGALARQIAADLADAGCPITLDDLAAHRAERRTPLALELEIGTALNFPPPTQGLASLMILGLFERVAARGGIIEPGPGSFAHLHTLVEATKRAFVIRDRCLADPDAMSAPARHYLGADLLRDLAADIDLSQALAWPSAGSPGDTVWLGAIDADGRAVSFIQSIYWEFGSGVVLERSGIHWQNRGSSFPLGTDHPNALGPGKKPFHTLNPALLQFSDGRVMTYGTMGGEGQPQTQAALLTRYAHYQQTLGEALDAPRWLLGRTWGETSTNLKLESRFDPALVDALRAVGHEVEVVSGYDQMMGHAGALVRDRAGYIHGASDPRSDGLVACW